MAEDMTIDSYLAKGGVLSNPSNVPPRLLPTRVRAVR